MARAIVSTSFTWSRLLKRPCNRMSFHRPHLKGRDSQVTTTWHLLPISIDKCALSIQADRAWKHCFWYDCADNNDNYFTSCTDFQLEYYHKNQCSINCIKTKQTINSQCHYLIMYKQNVQTHHLTYHNKYRKERPSHTGNQFLLIKYFNILSMSNFFYMKTAQIFIEHYTLLL